MKRNLKAGLVISAALAGALAASAQNPTLPRYMESEYASWPVYNGSDLELSVDNSGTHFTLWSPKADAAEVLIYDTDRNTAPIETLQMKRGENGTWRASVPQKLYGKFYTFRVTVGGQKLAETPVSGPRQSEPTASVRPS